MKTTEKPAEWQASLLDLQDFARPQAEQETLLAHLAVFLHLAFDGTDVLVGLVDFLLGVGLLVVVLVNVKLVV